MGQQQLFLLVLGLVIVGLAVVVGLQVFEGSNRQNQADDVLNRNVRLAMDAVSWRARATVHGGGGNGSYAPLADGGFEVMGVEGNVYATEHAILSATGTTLEIVGVSSASRGVGAYVRVEGNRIAESYSAIDGSITLPSD
ncbi:hypothetical protein [Rubricoccus marinus]|uniref:Type 4 fimbrial biogenesis protein PilX N-terminal domain-containing protein n=1 Tax=Rubricoccus marinus TaxID=716817 RepID=A0A259TW02_9BACT|nr:hypothetical protein [Rubricoccus marinus]OZC01945.1 hypothetical protein BSZ36_02455 [Rubricoccus marinus]